MVETYYTGTHRTQYDGGKYANQNCNPTTVANGVRVSTHGLIDRSGSQIRALIPRAEETSPTTPGWSLEDADHACAKLGVPYEVRRGTWADVIAVSNAGFFVHLQGDSDQFPNGTCSGVFDGDHSVGLHPNRNSTLRLLGDPICKGTRWESPSVLRNYVQKYANAHSSGVIRYGVFLQKVQLIAAPPVPMAYTLHIPTGLHSIRYARLSTTGTGCIAGWTTVSWSGNASSAPCGKQTTKPGCSAGTAPVALVTKGVFVGKYVRIENGITVS